jgi:xanthine/uracil permease
MIVAVGEKLLAEALESQNDVLMLTASLGLSAAVSFAPAGVFEARRPFFQILAGDGIVVGTLSAIGLDLVIREGRSRR